MFVVRNFMEKDVCNSRIPILLFMGVPKVDTSEKENICPVRVQKYKNGKINNLTTRFPTE